MAPRLVALQNKAASLAGLDSGNRKKVSRLASFSLFCKHITGGAVFSDTRCHGARGAPSPVSGILKRFLAAALRLHPRGSSPTRGHAAGRS